MKGQWPPWCLPPIMWSKEASSVSIERAMVWVGDNAALVATGRRTQFKRSGFIKLFLKYTGDTVMKLNLE